MIPRVEWYMSAEDFHRAQSDVRLHRLLSLSRIVNTIRFTEIAFLEAGQAATSKVTRQKVSAFLYLGALLYEGLTFAERLGEHFHESPAFREGFAKLFRDTSVKELRGGLLARLRNQAVYHHDDAAMVGGINLMSADEYTFADADGPSNADCYYTLADFAVMHFAIGQASTPKEFEQQFARASIAMVKLAVSFAQSADRLLAEQLRELGWRTRIADNPG